MKFCKERLIGLREKTGLSKAEAARRLKVSAMAYGRYESGEREPSFQTVVCIARVFDTSTDYLYGIIDNSEADSIVISKQQDPELYNLIRYCLKDNDTTRRLLSYSKKFIPSK